MVELRYKNTHVAVMGNLKTQLSIHDYENKQNTEKAHKRNVGCLLSNGDDTDERHEDMGGGGRGWHQTAK